MASTNVQVAPKAESSATESRRPSLALRSIAAVASLLLIFALEIFFSARTESQTFDEPAHLYAGYSYWLHGDFGVNPEHPPLVKLIAALPLLFSHPGYPQPLPIHFRFASAFGGMRLLAGPDSQSMLAEARAAVSVFAFALALSIFFAAREMFGQNAALLALGLCVFTPVIVGNAPLITTDVALACCMFAAVYAFYRYVKEPSWPRLAFCGVTAGLSLASKHSAVLLFPILLLLCVAEVVMYLPAKQKSASGRAGRARRTLQLVAALLAIAAISVAILWAFYGFRYAARPGGQQMTPATADYLRDLHQPVEAGVVAFFERHHLLPESYLYGLTDVVIITREGRAMYLFGQVYPQGRWFYFPSIFFVKMTLGFLLLLALVPFARALRGMQYRRELLFLVIPPVVFFGMAMTSRLDLGIRHILPAIPFLIVLAAAGAVALSRYSRGWSWAVGVLIIFHVASSMRVFPNYLPYSNEIFGGPEQTYKAASDANVGWGGGLKALHAAIDRQHIEQCWLAYSAPPDPASFGIPCKRLPTLFTIGLHLPQQAIPIRIEGPVFVSSEELSGVYWGPGIVNPYDSFTRIQPSRVIAGEILEFDGGFDVKPIAALSESVVAQQLLQQGKATDSLLHAQQAVILDPSLLIVRETLSAVYEANHLNNAAMLEYQQAENLYNAVSPYFQGAVFLPTRPGAQK